MKINKVATKISRNACFQQIVNERFPYFKSGITPFVRAQVFTVFDTHSKMFNLDLTEVRDSISPFVVETIVDRANQDCVLKIAALYAASLSSFSEERLHDILKISAQNRELKEDAGSTNQIECLPSMDYLTFHMYEQFKVIPRMEQIFKDAIRFDQDKYLEIKREILNGLFL